MTTSIVIDAHTGEAHQLGDRFLAAHDGFQAGASQARVKPHEFRQQANARHFDSQLQQMRADGRLDSFSTSQGLFMARDLEHVMNEVLREQYPAQNAFELFPMDTSVPPGAKTVTQRRLYQQGEASVYRAGVKVPMVGNSQAEETTPVIHIVAGFSTTIFEEQSANFAGFAQAAEDMRTCRDVIMERANQILMYGYKPAKVFGVLDYPWLGKKTVASSFVDATAADTILGELNSMANHPANVTKNVMRPNACATSPRLRNYLFSRMRSTGTDTTIGKAFVENQKMIQDMEEVHEFQGTGPGGTDYMFFYRKDRLGCTIIVPQGFTMLPQQAMGFEKVTYCYMSIGGVKMRQAGNNLLGIITPPPL